MNLSSIQNFCRGIKYLNSGLLQLRGCVCCQNKDGQLGDANNEDPGADVVNGVEPERKPGHDHDDGGRNGRSEVIFGKKV